MTKSPKSSTWSVEFSPKARKALKKLGAKDRARVVDFLQERVAGTTDPRLLGKPLHALKLELWRYRVGDIRIICHLEYDRVVVLVVALGHRREIYRD